MPDGAALISAYAIRHHPAKYTLSCRPDKAFTPHPAKNN